MPNIPDISVPDGDETASKEIHSFGEKPTFNFPVKNHIELMERLGLADFEKGAEVAGFRGYYLKGDAVTMNFALWQFTLNHFLKKNYSPMIVPSLVRRQTLLGTGYLPAV